MKKYYDANVADYVKPEEVRASAIIVKNNAQADRVLLEARGDAGKTNKGFRDLVLKYSSDEDTKLRGGDLRYFDAPRPRTSPRPSSRPRSRSSTPATCRASSTPGNGTFYILKQTYWQAAAASMTRSFEDAKPQIR